MILVRWAIRHPGWAIASMLVVTLVTAAGLPRLELRMDGHALVPTDDPVTLFDREVREQFGVRDPIVVFVRTSHPDGIYNLETLRRVQQLSEVLAGIEGIGPQQVMSLATERRDRVYPGTLKFRPFLDPLPETPVLMELLKQDVAAAAILTGTLVSADGRAAAILAGVPASTTGAGSDRPELYRRILAAVAPFATETDRILVVGAPVAEALLGRHVLEDLFLLLPLTIGMIALVLWLSLRRTWGVVLSLTEVAACLLWTFGLMGWLGVPVYLTTGILPVILITIGLADEIHVFCHYQWRLAHDEDRGVAVVERTLEEMFRPVLLTSLTTSIGFLSFRSSEIEPIRTFGVFATLGILFCLVWTLTVIPAALVLIPADKMRGRGPLAAPTGRGGSRTRRAVAPFLRHRRLTLAGLALLTVGMGLGLPKLYVQDSWIDGFAPDSAFRRDTDAVNASLAGTHVLLVHLEVRGRGPGDARAMAGSRGHEDGPLLDPELLEEIGRLESFLADHPGVGGVLGPHSHLSTVAYLWLARKPGHRKIPDEIAKVKRVMTFFDVVRGKHRRREVIHDEMDQALVTVFLKNANYQETRALIEEIRAYERRHLAPRSVHLSLAGDVAVSQAMIPAIVRTQVSSLLLALLGAFVTLCVIFRSLRFGALALLPAAVSVLWAFGLMGWLDVPLGVATSMFCAISLGVGVDYAIHFLASFRRAAAAGHPRPALGALEESGPAIVTDFLAIAAGFGLLVMSQVPANARLGLLVAIALTTGCVLTLVGLGAWLSRPAAGAPAASAPLSDLQLLHGVVEQYPPGPIHRDHR